MQADQGQQQAVPPVPQIRLAVGTATVDDVKAALGAGLRDMTKRPVLSLFFGLAYALIGAALLSGLLVFEQVWIVIAAAVGFPLVAPFLAAGLYEMSRRLKGAEPFSATDIFLVVFNQQRRQFGWMALIVLFAFWLWASQVRLMLALFLQNKPLQTLRKRRLGPVHDGRGRHLPARRRPDPRRHRARAARRDRHFPAARPRVLASL